MLFYEGRVARAYAPSLLRRRATRNSYDFGFKEQALFVLQMECHSLSFACDVNLSSLEQPLRVAKLILIQYLCISVVSAVQDTL